MILTDEDIQRLLSEPKYFPDNPRLTTKPKAHAQHEEKELILNCPSKLEFKMRLNKHRFKPNKFSIILLYLNREAREWVRLFRCNGVHEHTNKLEGTKFEDFHIHKATQHYMEAGFKEDSYAEMASYSDYNGAIEYFISETNCQRVSNEPTLF